MCLGTPHHHHHQTQISLGPRPSRWRKNLDPRMHAIFTASISVSDPPPPRPQLLKYIILKLHVQGCIIILVYSIRFGYLWITCIYICQGFLSLSKRALVSHMMYSVLVLRGIISRSPLRFCGKRTRNFPWRISRFRFPTKTKSKSVLYVLKKTMRLVTFGSNLPVYYG